MSLPRRMPPSNSTSVRVPTARDHFWQDAQAWPATPSS